MQWIKIDTHLTKDLRLRGFTAQEMATWFAMMCMAGREDGNKRGRLRNNKRPARLPEIALESGVDVAVVEATLAKAIANALLVEVVDEETGEHNYEISDWDLTQVDRTASARQARHREKAAAERALEMIAEAEKAAVEKQLASMHSGTDISPVTCDDRDNALEEKRRDEMR